MCCSKLFYNQKVYNPNSVLNNCNKYFCPKCHIFLVRICIVWLVYSLGKCRKLVPQVSFAFQVFILVFFFSKKYSISKMKMHSTIISTCLEFLQQIMRTCHLSTKLSAPSNMSMSPNKMSRQYYVGLKFKKLSQYL